MMKQTIRSGAHAWLRRAGLALGGVGALAGASVPAASAQEAESPSKATCAQAYESAQESRAAGQLQETRRRLALCARPECPSFVQKDCARWLDEVDGELPSVIVQASGLDPNAARSIEVKIDGAPVPDALNGSAIPLDPGRHELIAQSPGRPSVTRVIVAQQGVRNRTVTLDFLPLPPPTPAADVAVDTGSGGSPLRPYAYVAWGVGAVGLGAFAVLGTLGRADERALKDDCPLVAREESDLRPGVCLESRANERKSIYKREFVMADVSLVAGLVGVATGTVLFILAASDTSGSAGSDASASLHWDVMSKPGGGLATVSGAF